MRTSMGVLIAAGTLMGAAATPTSAAPVGAVVAPFSAYSTSVNWSVGGLSLHCPVSTATGEVLGAGPGPVARVRTLTLGSLTKPCNTALGGLDPVVAATPLSAFAQTVDPGTGATTGYVTGVRVSFRVSSCSFEVTGSLAFARSGATAAVFDSATHRPTVSNASPGCAGAVPNGSPVAVDATYVLTP